MAITPENVQHIRSSVTQRFRRALIVWTILSWVVMLADVGISFSSNTSTLFVVTTRMGQLIYLFVLPLWCSHVYRRQHMSDNQLSFLLVVAAIATCLSALVTEKGRLMPMNVAIYVFGMLLLNTQQPMLHCLMFLPSYLIAMYNMTFGVHGYPGALIASSESNLTADLVAHVRTAVYVVILILSINSQTKAYVKSLTQMQVTVEMTKVVSEELKHYRTGSAKMALEEYLSKGEADSELCQLLSTLIENLNSYRPFIPHYLLKTKKNRNSGINTTATLGFQSKKVVVAAEADNTNLASSMNSLEDQSSDDDGCESIEPQRPKDAVIVPPSSAPTTPLRGFFSVRRPVSYAMLQYAVQSLDIFEDPRTIRLFVDTAFKAVSRFGGVAHSFLADTVHATWNGVEPCESHARRAVECVQHITMRMDYKVSLFGGITTGVADCKMTGTHHQAFLMHVEWGDALLALYNAGRRIQTIALCGETIKDFDRGKSILIDITVAHAWYTQSDLVYVYEPLTSIYDAATQPKHERFIENLRITLDHCMEGDFQTALASVQSMITSEVSYPVSNRRKEKPPNSVIALRKKILFCLEKGLEGKDFPLAGSSDNNIVQDISEI
eukprot:PhF_6_TR21029/c0_g1_i1/m.30241